MGVADPIGAGVRQVKRWTVGEVLKAKQSRAENFAKINEVLQLRLARHLHHFNAGQAIDVAVVFRCISHELPDLEFVATDIMVQ